MPVHDESTNTGDILPCNHKTSKLRGVATAVRSIQALQSPKQTEEVKQQPLTYSSSYQGLDAKIVELCETNVPLRRRLAHLSMTHAEADEINENAEDELELIGGDVLKDKNENELLAILRKQALNNALSPRVAEKINPSIQKSKSAIDLPPVVDSDVADAIQHDLVMAVPKVVWTTDFEIPYQKFKRKRRGAAANLSSAQLFRSFLMTPLFRQMHAATYGVTHFHQDTTGEFEAVDFDPTRKHGLQKRFQKLAKPVRDSLELSLSTHMLDALDHLTTIYTSARRDFLSNMTAYCKHERMVMQSDRQRIADMAEKRQRMRDEVKKTKQVLSHVSLPLHATLKTPRASEILRPVQRRSKEHSFAWKRIKEIEQCNVERSLLTSIEYAKAVHSDGIGGGISTEAMKSRHRDSFGCYILFIQRLYRGHLARRYVCALKWMCCMWKRCFFPPKAAYDESNSSDDRGFLRLEDFEATFDYFCFQSTPERVYLAGFALTVPPSRLGPHYVEYKRFKRYWHRFMYRTTNQGDRIRFVQFIRSRQTVLTAMDTQRETQNDASGTTFLLKTDAWKKFSIMNRSMVETEDKYQSHLSSLSEEYRTMGLKARRALLAKEKQSHHGWELVRDLVQANTIRQTKYRSVQKLVSHLQDTDELDGRRRISLLREEMLDVSAQEQSTSIQLPAKSPTKLGMLMSRLIQAVKEARAFVVYLEEVGLDLADDCTPHPPPCMEKLANLKHVRGCTKLADLVERQQSLNHRFQGSWYSFNSRSAIMGPDGVNIITSNKKYVIESMHVLSLMRRQLRSSIQSSSKKGNTLVANNLHQSKRIDQFHALLLAFDSNVRNMSIILESYDESSLNSI